MPSLSKRVWRLPNGEMWITWRVEWREFGHPRRKPFHDQYEAVAFLIRLKRSLEMRKADSRKRVKVARTVYPRALGAKVRP